jgi:hypothetical protein
MIYVVWSPEDAKVKSKMVYAHARGTLRSCLAGISREIKATEFSELSYDVVLGRMPAKWLRWATNQMLKGNDIQSSYMQSWTSGRIQVRRVVGELIW